MVVNGRRTKAQVAEQDEEVEATRLRRGKNLALDLVRGGANRICLRLVEKQLVIRPRQAAEFLLKHRETVTGQRHHRASETQ